MFDSEKFRIASTRTVLVLLVALVFLIAACSSSADDTTTATSDVDESADETVADETTEESADATEEADATGDEDGSEDSVAVESFTIEVWADNWMGVYVDGTLIGEDSVSITTERSFNSETFEFEAAYPFTLAIEAKDYIETDSGLEYIGLDNQQIGDGGIIAQVKDSSGTVVAVTTGDWLALVTHQAPLNTDCESAADPDTECDSEISSAPSDWTSSDFDDSAWDTATVWDAEAVDPKIGYDDISWDSAAEFLWGSDLQVDNIVLLRTVVTG